MSTWKLSVLPPASVVSEDSADSDPHRSRECRCTAGVNRQRHRSGRIRTGRGRAVDVAGERDVAGAGVDHGVPPGERGDACDGEVGTAGGVGPVQFGVLPVGLCPGRRHRIRDDHGLAAGRPQAQNLVLHVEHHVVVVVDIQSGVEVVARKKRRRTVGVVDQIHRPVVSRDERPCQRWLAFGSRELRDETHARLQLATRCLEWPPLLVAKANARAGGAPLSMTVGNAQSFPQPSCWIGTSGLVGDSCAK